MARGTADAWLSEHAALIASRRAAAVDDGSPLAERGLVAGSALHTVTSCDVKLDAVSAAPMQVRTAHKSRAPTATAV